MSVEIIQSFPPPPLKRARETISLASDGASKCAEIFVTNNADKWTFFCAYCQKATCDIGAFICHIRLEHLNSQSDQTPELQNNVPINTNAEVSTQTTQAVDELTIDGPQQSTQNDIIKEELTIMDNEEHLQTICSKVSQITDITSLEQPESVETESLIANKNSIASSNRRHSIQDEYFVVTLVNKEDSQQSQLIEEITEKNVHNTGDDTDTDESDTVSCYSANETNDTHLESQQDNSASYSKPHTKRRKKNLGVEEDTELLHHKCPYCKLGYKTKQAVFQHILHNHDENYHQKLPWKCEECHRGFLTTSGLNAHLKSHDKDRHLQCPVCLSKHKDNYFITHVMTHESDTCFPCQVCGQLYNSHKERMQHWEIHAEEKPFYCKICYRRFRKQQYLTHHLKTHNKYQCNFCPEQFNSTVTQRPPYVCSSCKDLPDIKQHIKHLRSLAYNSHVFESDEETFPKPAAQHNEEFIDNKQIPQRNEESSNEPDNDSNANAAVSVNEEIDNEEAFSYEDGSDLEFIDDSVDNDDNVPSGSGHNKSPSHQQTIQSEEGMYNCLHCRRAFNTQRALSTHTKRTHINQSAPNCPYNCSYCNRGFQTKSGLNFHEKTHDKNKYEFKCPLCSITTFRECDFITHVLLHESPTCYPCQVCGKICSTSEERLAHWATHVQERPYGCKFCYRRFARKQILHRHMRSHKQ